MPKITLRLTDEQHERLVKAAAENQRSLQGELIYRAFPPIHPDRLVDHFAEREARPDPKPGKR